MQADPSQPLTEDVAREVAKREGMSAVISGEITEAGGSYVLTARVVSASDGLELASHRETARDGSEIIPAIDRLSGKIREKIGESFTSLRSDAPLEAVTTTSLEALELYSEAIESIDPGPIEAVRATGANWPQMVVYAVLPQIVPTFLSFTLYRWDINVRMSTIIGAVGGGGIGFLLIQWIRLLDYGAAGIAVWFIAITVAALDYVSSKIRESYV